MKAFETIFPIGSFDNQKSDGMYIDKTLSENLDIFAKNIVKDHHFLIIITGHDSVGNGKSTLSTHIGSYLTAKINELYNLNNTFTSNNLVFKTRDLPEKSLVLPKYSVISSDEGDDLTTHSLKEMMVNLKRYFRKCRQLNQILILILPSFFELPKFFALSRSHALIDCRFYGHYQRGVFDLYSSRAKKLLYLRGKKDWNWDIQKPSFSGRFFGNYAFFPNVKEETKKYLALKYKDLHDDAFEEVKISKYLIERQLKIRLFKQLYENMDGITIKQLAQGFGIGLRTSYRWLKDDVHSDFVKGQTYNTSLTKGEENMRKGLTEDDLKDKD